MVALLPYFSIHPIDFYSLLQWCDKLVDCLVDVETI